MSNIDLGLDFTGKHIEAMEDTRSNTERLIADRQSPAL
jgi:hypothetical protein